jgi:hypothetical protein
LNEVQTHADDDEDDEDVNHGKGSISLKASVSTKLNRMAFKRLAGELFLNLYGPALLAAAAWLFFFAG